MEGLKTDDMRDGVGPGSGIPVRSFCGICISWETGNSVRAARGSVLTKRSFLAADASDGKIEDCHFQVRGY
jgi:hypothetical protein